MHITCLRLDRIRHSTISLSQALVFQDPCDRVLLEVGPLSDGLDDTDSSSAAFFGPTSSQHAAELNERYKLTCRILLKRHIHHRHPQILIHLPHALIWPPRRFSHSSVLASLLQCSKKGKSTQSFWTAMTAQSRSIAHSSR